MSATLSEGRALWLWLMTLASACLIHATLPDYEQREWGGQREWLLLSAMGLFWSARVRLRDLNSAQPFARWAQLKLKLTRWAPTLCLSSLVSHKLYTLLALRDVLTQSALLLTMCLIALMSCWGEGDGTLKRTALRRVRELTALTYLGAALHKLNETFLSAPESCAVHGAEVSFKLVGLPWPAPPSVGLWLLDDAFELLYMLSTTPWVIGGVVIIVELALFYGVWRSRRWAWLLGLTFHLPLTLTIAPSFAWVMFCGYWASTLSIEVRPRRADSSFLSTCTLHPIWETSAWASSLYLLTSPETAQPELKALALCVCACWGRLVTPRAAPVSHIEQPQVKSERLRPQAPRAIMALITALYGLHMLSPYLGVEVQHSGAMLSNLRVDPECFNSLIAPRGGWDPYLRIDEAQLGDAERPLKVRVLKEQLWGWAALNAIRRNWCSPVTSPLRLVGTWSGVPFVIEDLCAPDGLSALREEHPFKTSLPSGWQRLQKNLSRRCDQACLH